MSDYRLETIPTNGIQLRAAIQGEGPMVVFCHGMPGLWYSWRHQLEAVAAAGFTAVAIDQRGYGGSDRPVDPAEYDSQHTVGDLVGLLDSLQQEKAIFVGTDFGAAQVYNMAIRHPERVAAVVGVACPYDFDFSGRGGVGSNPPADATYERPFARPDLSPNECFAAIAEHQFFYAHYYQTIGPAEKELGSNARLFLSRLFWALSGKGRLLDWSEHPATVDGYLDVLADPEIELPWPWMSEADMDYYVSEFEKTGVDTAFIGGINSYRVANKNWEIGLDYADAQITQPSLFIAGEKDPVITMIDPNALNVLRQRSPDLRGIHLIPEAGHFVQQERPEQFNKFLLEFLKEL